MFAFGSGVLIGTPSGANPTPVNFGLVQEVTIDDTATLKSLFGQNRRAVAVGAGTIKTTGKAKAAKISGLAMASLYYGVSLVTGQLATVYGEAGSVPGVSTYTITVANSANWQNDLGVLYAGTGLPLKRVASGPSAGQYSVAAGVYTFAAADANAAVLISYNYTISASGQKLLMNNPLLGATVSFGVTLYGLDPTTNLGYSLQLYNCVSSKFTFGTKLEDFVMPEFDFECFVNAAGNLGQWNFPDAA